jgi:hypothetical protein
VILDRRRQALEHELEAILKEPQMHDKLKSVRAAQTQRR